MNPFVVRLHGLIQYYEAMRAWGIVENLKTILDGILKRELK